MNRITKQIYRIKEPTVILMDRNNAVGRIQWGAVQSFELSSLILSIFPKS